MRAQGSWTLAAALAVAGLPACSPSRVPLDALSGTAWQLASGASVTLDSLEGRKATVFVTLDPECPFSQAYTTVLDSLHRRFAPQGIAFAGVYPGPFFQGPAVADFAVRSGLRFPQVMDAGCELTNALQARVTPEAFVVDPQGAVIYRGAIDDSAVRAGRKKPGATRPYLREALQHVVEGSAVDERAVTAVGCIVECR
jgi:hypothetical protein